jgi:hypothetical protein
MTVQLLLTFITQLLALHNMHWGKPRPAI